MQYFAHFVGSKFFRYGQYLSNDEPFLNPNYNEFLAFH